MSARSVSSVFALIAVSLLATGCAVCPPGGCGEAVCGDAICHSHAFEKWKGSCGPCQGPKICPCTGPACHDCGPSCGCEPACDCEPACGAVDPGCGCEGPCGCGDACCPLAARGPVRQTLRKVLGHCFGCAGCDGELYWSEWHNDPPRCCDPCDRCGNWIGPSAGYRAPYDHAYSVADKNGGLEVESLTR